MIKDNQTVFLFESAVKLKRNSGPKVFTQMVAIFLAQGRHGNGMKSAPWRRKGIDPYVGSSSKNVTCSQEKK